MQAGFIPGEKDWKLCTRCGLAATRRFVVLRRTGYAGPYRNFVDEGDRELHILLLGEAPGEFEDHSGEPFKGPSGRILREILRRSVPFKYTLTNVVGCRPTKQGKRELENRQPTAEEIEACRPRLDQLVHYVSFDSIVYLGRVAESFKTKLPTLTLLHPANIVRMEYKLFSIKEQALLLSNHVRNLKKKE